MISLGSLGEIFIILIAILILIKPKDIPNVLYDLGRLKHKIYLKYSQITNFFFTNMEQGELAEYEEQVNKKYCKTPKKNSINEDL